jgi:exosome complex component RRP40
VLEALGSALPFELAVGLNGRVWVNAAKPSHVVLVGNVICQAETMTPEEVTQRVRALVKAL